MSSNSPSQRERLRLRAGDRVMVRTEAEILATLDEYGELDSLPFMPEMLRFCGRSMTVRKVATKACDTVSRSGLRRMDDAVHLVESRCDGSAHGGCENACSIYWKEAWLIRVDDEQASEQPTGYPEPVTSVAVLHTRTRRDRAENGEERYSCQATELLRAAPRPVPFTDLGQYVRDIASRNVGPVAVVRAFFVALYNRIQHVCTRVLPARLLLRGGLPWGLPRGRAIGRTPTMQLDLRPGELVRIRSKHAIEETLDKDLKNRGLGFDAEMGRLCGREARVERLVEKVIDEKTGRMVHMKNPCVVLEGVICEGAYNANCPRAWICFWREIWLERVEQPGP